jgi:hypothetical protein
MRSAANDHKHRRMPVTQISSIDSQAGIGPFIDRIRNTVDDSMQAIGELPEAGA